MILDMPVEDKWKGMVTAHEGITWNLPCWSLNDTAAKKSLLKERCVQDLLDIICFQQCPAR